MLSLLLTYSILKKKIVQWHLKIIKNMAYLYKNMAAMLDFHRIY